MADIGGINEVINASQVHLDLGSDRHILLQELSGNIGRPENREAADIGSVYFYGQHDNSFNATLLLSAPEFDTFVGYTVLDANGALPENSFKIIITAKDGTTKTMTVTVVVPNLPWDKPIEGGLKIRPTFRITQNVTTSDIATT